MIDPMLSIESLKIWVGGNCLTLQGPLALHAGQTYLVVGPSGIGKSSLARVLLGLHGCVSPAIRAEGRVALTDRAVKADSQLLLDGRKYYRFPQHPTALIPQLGQQGFIDELSVRANLALFSELGKADFQPKLEAMAAKLRVWPLPAAVARASGGEKMRLSVLRAMLPRTREERPPVLLVADEPTVGLDDQNADQVVQMLREVAVGAGTITLIITHEPYRFTKAEVSQPAKTISLLRIGPQELEEVGQLTASGAQGASSGFRRLGGWFASKASAFMEATGAVVLSPLAFLVGLVQQNRSLLRSTFLHFLGTAFNLGTLVFVCSASVMISLTLAIFLFRLLPSRELIEPLILTDLIKGLGITLQVVLIPLMASLFAIAKNSAAQSARFASSVRSGLLDTLTLARISIDSYALTPSVLGQIASLFFTTLVASFLGLVAGAAVIANSGVEMGIGSVLAMMVEGMDDFAPGWVGWVVWKLLASGFVGGALAAWVGTRPNQSEADVALAVRRSLLWGMFAVLLLHSILVIAQFS